MITTCYIIIKKLVLLAWFTTFTLLSLPICYFSANEYMIWISKHALVSVIFCPDKQTHKKLFSAQQLKQSNFKQQYIGKSHLRSGTTHCRNCQHNFHRSGRHYLSLIIQVINTLVADFYGTWRTLSHIHHTGFHLHRPIYLRKNRLDQCVKSE